MNNTIFLSFLAFVGWHPAAADGRDVHFILSPWYGALNKYT
jgi:hypothetical protein